MDGDPRSVWGRGWSLHVHRKQMPRMGLPHYELWYFQVTPGPIPVEPRCHLRPNEVSRRKSLSTLGSGGTCLRRSPHAATCHSTTLLSKNVPIFTGIEKVQNMSHCTRVEPFWPDFTAVCGGHIRSHSIIRSRVGRRALVLSNNEY